MSFSRFDLHTQTSGALIVKIFWKCDVKDLDQVFLSTDPSRDLGAKLWEVSLTNSVVLPVEMH
jgi:hypothetical protein